mgnify:FL=1
MGLGTIAVNKEVFNLDLMNSEELELLLESVEKEKNKVKREIKKLKWKDFKGLWRIKK